MNRNPDAICSQIAAIEQQITALPAGSVAKKNIRGKQYYYHRWYEGKKRIEKYIPLGDAEQFCAQIEKRKSLEKDLKSLRGKLPADYRMEKEQEKSKHEFRTNVRVGNVLRAFSENVRAYQKRDIYPALPDFVYHPPMDKVFILYGLRRTGKTTMIRQILAEMSDADLERAAFIQITAKNTLADVNNDLKALESMGYCYVFLDEVTLMEDFIEGAALFSDVFAACGMRIVMSGTDSLGFLFTEDEQLYDRCVMLHTTFISYHEFENVLGIRGIDEYIRYGGTMSLGGSHYNESSTFASRESTEEYIDSAIAKNIQHSLRCYQYAGHFRNLRELYNRDELTSAINRVVEDINHRFTLDVLTRDFRSNDLGISAGNLRRDRTEPTDILDRIDIEDVTRRLRHLLEIRNRPEQTVLLNDAHVREIREYLKLLDLTQDIEIHSLPDVDRKSTRTVIAQPGLRYAQACALINSLMQDKEFSNLSLEERNRVTDWILSEIRGRMMEDIILLETKIANPKKDVFILQFPIGEFDMVVFDPERSSCELFEIKHSDQVIENQYRHLIDKDKCSETEHRYGHIVGKYVLYRGESREFHGIQYVNVEEYLSGLHRSAGADYR